MLDWDGTVTVRDTLWMVLERFGDRAVFERAENELVRGEISYRELMELEMGTVRAPLDEVNSFLAEHARVRPGFRALAERWRPVILSSGFRELIEPLLEREGVHVDVVANSIDPRADGWRVRWNDDAPCPECGDLCKRRSAVVARLLDILNQLVEGNILVRVGVQGSGTDALQKIEKAGFSRQINSQG